MATQLFPIFFADLPYKRKYRQSISACSGNPDFKMSPAPAIDYVILP
jgi:hypothetical protein